MIRSPQAAARWIFRGPRGTGEPACSIRPVGGDTDLVAFGPEGSLRLLVRSLQAMRGVPLIAAMTLVDELQDFLRFDNPRKLMAYVVGLVPGEHSGPKRRQGSNTKASNSADRRMLLGVAWHYQHSARVSPTIATRQDERPKAVTDVQRVKR